MAKILEFEMRSELRMDPLREDRVPQAALVYSYSTPSFQFL